MKTILLSVIALTLLTGPVLAQPNEEEMKAWKEYSTPGAEHKQLAEAAGKWTYTSKSWHKPDQKPEESSGTAAFKMILGGRFLQQDIKGKAMGQDFVGHGMVGYDNAKKAFNSVWLDNMGTGIMYSTGTWNAETKTLSDKGEFSCPMNDNKKATYRSDWVFVDKKTMTFTMYVSGMKGVEGEYKMMEMTYKKK